MALNGLDVVRSGLAQVLVAGHHHLANHACQPHALAVFGAENAHAVGGQISNLFGHNHPAAAAKHLNMLAATLFKQGRHVFEILHMPALVGAYRNALHVFLQRSSHHIVHRAVVPQMHHFHAHAHKNTAHDVDGGVMPVKKRSRRDKTHFVRRAVVGQGCVVFRQVGHAGLQNMLLHQLTFT